MNARLPEQTDTARAPQSADQSALPAGAPEDSAERRTEFAADRTEFAADRTVLAAERTYAAWVRTGLGALAAGVGAKALFGHLLPVRFASLIASLLILFSAFCFLAAVWRELHPGVTPPPGTPRLPAPLLIVVNGALVFVDLVALVGVWWVKALD
jgi:putative membrane protein